MGSGLGQPQVLPGWRLSFPPHDPARPADRLARAWVNPPPPPRPGGPQSLQTLTEKVVLVTSTLLWEMPPLRLPGRPPLCGFFWLVTMVSMEWLRTRMALCGDSR